MTFAHPLLVFSLFILMKFSRANVNEDSSSLISRCFDCSCCSSFYLAKYLTWAVAPTHMPNITLLTVLLGVDHFCNADKTTQIDSGV